MSFCGSFSEAKSANGVEDKYRSMESSPVRDGSDSPGGAAASTKANATQTVGRLRAGIKTPLTRTDSLTRSL